MNMAYILRDKYDDKDTRDYKTVGCEYSNLIIPRVFRKMA